MPQSGGGGAGAMGSSATRAWLAEEVVPAEDASYFVVEAAAELGGGIFATFPTRQSHVAYGGNPCGIGFLARPHPDLLPPEEGKAFAPW